MDTKVKKILGKKERISKKSLGDCEIFMCNEV